MAWCKSNRLYDPIRRKFVRATPEEKVRQRLLQQMIAELGYPKGLIAVEKDLALGFRRIDILCYAPGGDGLRPLLLIECKAEKLNSQAERQALGYNERICAPFIALAGGMEIKTFWKEANGFASVSFLPRFDQLVEQLCRI